MTIAMCQDGRCGPWPAEGAPLERRDTPREGVRDYLGNEPIYNGASLQIRMPLDAWLGVRYETEHRMHRKPGTSVCAQCGQGEPAGGHRVSGFLRGDKGPRVWRHKTCPPPGTVPVPMEAAIVAVLYFGVGHAHENRFAIVEGDKGGYHVCDRKAGVLVDKAAVRQPDPSDPEWTVPMWDLDNEVCGGADWWATEWAAQRAASALQALHESYPLAHFDAPEGALFRWPGRRP